MYIYIYMYMFICMCIYILCICKYRCVYMYTYVYKYSTLLSYKDVSSIYMCRYHIFGGYDTSMKQWWMVKAVDTVSWGDFSGIDTGTPSSDTPEYHEFHSISMIFPSDPNDQYR